MQRVTSILHIEESEKKRTLFREALADSECALIQASTATEAIEHLSDKHAEISMIVIDIPLPDTDWIALIQTIREEKGIPPLPIILFAPNDSPESVLRAYQTGASCVVDNPPDEAAYVANVKSMMHFWCSAAVVPPKEREFWGR